jgi:hypothetical protein
MAQVTKITKGVLSMPGSEIGIDRTLSLCLMAVFTRRCLGTALGTNRLCREKKKYPGCYD